MGITESTSDLLLSHFLAFIPALNHRSAALEAAGLLLGCLSHESSICADSVMVADASGNFFM